MRVASKLLLATSVVVAAAFSSVTSLRAQAPAPRLDIETWRQQYEDSLRAEYGWLSVAGLEFLSPGVHTLGSLANNDIRLPAGHTPLEVGRLVVTPTSTTLHLRPGVSALLNGKPAPAKMTLGKARPGAPGQPATPPDKVRVGKVEFHLHESGERLALRVRDPESSLRVGFQGTRWFAPADDARVVATLRRFPAPRAVAVPNILGDDEAYTAPGLLEFTYAGTTVKALAFTATRGRLQLIFRDGTVGRETYGTRFVHADPRPDGTFDLDLNRTYNPPCAYNPYTTCPTPPAENQFKLEIRAGEKLYHGAAVTTAAR